jgi:hypothetical protein
MNWFLTVSTGKGELKIGFVVDWYEGDRSRQWNSCTSLRLPLGAARFGLELHASLSVGRSSMLKQAMELK